MPKLGVVLVSVREGRVGPAICDWFLERAREHGGFELEVIDLKAVDLPLLREPNHPRLRKYSEAKTIEWSATVAGCDAFVFVSPEYNFSTPPSLVNALDHLYHEWSYKAAGLVSYGGASGGLRAAQMTRLMLTTFKMVPIVEGVSIPFVGKSITDGKLAPTDALDRTARALLDELARWTTALEVLRAG